MHYKTEVIKVTYAVFEPGERVTPSSAKETQLEEGKVYTVERFIAPCVSVGELSGTLFLEGHRYGFDACYFDPVQEGQ